MKTKQIPALVMLTAGFAMCLISILNGYSLSFLIRALFFVLIGFYLLGTVIRIVVEFNFSKKQEDVTAEDLGFEDGEILEDIEDENEDVSELERNGQ